MKKIITVSFIILLPLLNVYSVDDPAILVRGPIPHDGIEFLGINAIPSEYGEYRYRNDTIIIYYTVNNIYLSDEWADSDCRVPGLSVLTPRDGRIIAAYTDKKGWTAFLSFNQNAEYLCSFIETYVSRQNYFLNISRGNTGFSFPAVLEPE